MNDNEIKTKNALYTFAQTKTGTFVLGVVAAIAPVLVLLGIEAPDFLAHTQMIQEFYTEQKAETAEMLNLLQGIRRAENMPERLQWDLFRLEGLSVSNQAYGIAFMAAAAEILSQEQYKQIHFWALQEVDTLKRDLHEMAEPTMPLSLQEKLRRMEEENDAD
jgi:hypothetical protein